MASNEPQGHIYRPIPRRPFEITPATPETASPPTPRSPDPDALSPSEFSPKPNGDTPADGGLGKPTRSVLNLTSSTLFGIYQPTSGSDDPLRGSEPPTPWGTGAETPERRTSAAYLNNGDADELDGIQPKLMSIKSRQQKPRARRAADGVARRRRKSGYTIGDLASMVGREIALFIFGIAYGVFISHLHSQEQIAPVKVEGFDRASWAYFGFWGAAAVGLGNLLPWFDWIWENGAGEDAEEGETQTESSGVAGKEREGQLNADWNPVVRSIGAFVGIVFAIRKLPWQSTLQVSLALAMVNPALWYLLDRSKPGLTLSSAVGLAGTALLLLINPDWVPSPARCDPVSHNSTRDGGSRSQLAGAGLLGGVVSYESIGVATWIGSVLFCSCVCFGNIGRRLAPSSSAVAASAKV